jgi:RNA polymerase sigma-70 factor, ECF subfamily
MTLHFARDLIDSPMEVEGDCGSEGEITRLLRDWNNPASRDRLASLIYPELRRIAAARLRWERSGHTLQPTALVSEVFLHLAKTEDLDWHNREHFFAVVSEKMRRILVDYARRRLSAKRGAGVSFGTIDSARLPAQDCFAQWVEIDDLLDELEKANPRVGIAFKLHYFVGLTFEQVGEALAVHVRTARRDCSVARAWLYAAFEDSKEKKDGHRSAGKA